MKICIAVAIISYLIGSISFSVIFTKKIAGFDVRDKGSKNAGSTNVLRTAGKKVALITLLCDVLKGICAVLLAVFIGNKCNFEHTEILVQIAAFLVVFGHTFPIFFGFKGGKGVATSLGVLLLVNWKLGLIVMMYALVLIALTRFVSLGSIAAAILTPILTIFINDCYLVDGNYFIFGVLLAIFVCYNHRANIKRLMDGNENRLSFNKS